jgi:glutamate 5-kinase
MRIVIKVGTSTLAHATGRLNIKRTGELCEVLSDLKNAGHEVVLVSSGAIGMGAGKLGLREKPTDIPTKQAAAAVGQCELMYTYDRLFTDYGHTVAQILLTGDDFNAPDRHENFNNTICRLLDLGALPIINENDTVATEEIKVGDNDTLSALVAVSVGAELLVILSDVDGLYSADPHTEKTARLITELYTLDERVYALAGGAGSALGTGGMKTKLTASKICFEAGCDTVIANGNAPKKLYDIVAGKSGAWTRIYAGGKKE